MEPLAILETITENQYAGSYEQAVFLDDGGILCSPCCNNNQEQLLESTRTKADDGWQVVSGGICWEGFNPCDLCGRDITVYTDEE